MPGLFPVALAALLLPQTAPHPSTTTPYEAPAVRPFEPPPGFGQGSAEGDGADALRRSVLEAPVSVDAYVRSYETGPAESEIAYDQGVASAELRADQTAGPMDGYWRVLDRDGEALFDLVLRDEGGVVEGGWRNRRGAGAAVLENGELRLEGLGVLRLQRSGAGWRGVLRGGAGDGRVTLSRPG